jgi:hypothetical protein
MIVNFGLFIAGRGDLLPIMAKIVPFREHYKS